MARWRSAIESAGWAIARAGKRAEMLLSDGDYASKWAYPLLKGILKQAQADMSKGRSPEIVEVVGNALDLGRDIVALLSKADNEPETE